MRLGVVYDLNVTDVHNQIAIRVNEISLHPLHIIEIIMEKYNLLEFKRSYLDKKGPLYKQKGQSL